MALGGIRTASSIALPSGPPDDIATKLIKNNNNAEKILEGTATLGDLAGSIGVNVESKVNIVK